MKYRVLFCALFCACVVGCCQGEENSTLLQNTSATTESSSPNVIIYRRYARGRRPHAHSYPPSSGLSKGPSWSSWSGPSMYPSRKEFESSNSTIWLSELQFITRTGLNVDINLPRIAHTEKCSFITPDNKNVSVEENDVAGVTTYNSSDYVSCRIVIGPMEESLIGKWTICGSYTEDNVEHRRCQRANIVWRDSANPGLLWQTTIQPKFDHVVNFYGILSPTVRGSGNVVSCHLLTPNNEDLFVTRESEYPNIRLVQDTDSACSIAIGPIRRSHLGSWAIYGKFNSALSGFNEVGLPMNFSLYDKNHPYDQAYNVTYLNPMQYVVKLGSTIEVVVASTDAVVVCVFTMPSGMSYNTIDHANRMPTGASFVNDNRTACRLSIGPLTQNMLGPWLLHGRFSNGDVFIERRLSFAIIQDDGSRTGTEEPEGYLTNGTESWRRGTEEPGHYYNTETDSWRRGTEKPGHYYNTRTEPQSDRVVVEVPGSLAIDQDVHFAISLVPMLRHRNLRDKLDMQVDILKFFKSKITRDENY